MTKITEILGEKKFAGSKNSSITTRVTLESEKEQIIDNELFYRVDAQDLYINERQQSNKYRLYGKINPYIQLDLNNGSENLGIERKNLVFNHDNWYGFVLKPKRLIISETLSQKGHKRIVLSNDDNTTKLNVDLTSGLPARTSYNSNNDNFCMVFLLGHNFKINDRVNVISFKNNLLPNGVYTVIDVKNNKVFIDTPAPLVNEFKTQNQIVENPSADLLEKKLSNNSVDTFNKKENNSVIVSTLKFESNPSKNISDNTLDINTVLTPEYYVSKIVEKEKLQYYVKVLEVIDVINEFDDCAYSTTPFYEKIKTFTVNNTIDTTNSVDNIGEPLTNLYFGIIKKTNGFPKLSSVESYFAPFIDVFKQNDGLETITNVRVGDVFYHSVCEYSQDNLIENEISIINHRFIHNNISFSYKPFYQIPLKLKSSYIEDGDNVLDMPNYAVYSRQREKYIWRDIIDIGIADENGRSLDYPFMNGAHYIFSDVNFYLKTEKKYVKKYELNVNDLNNVGNSLLDNISDLTTILNEITNDLNNNQQEIPFYNYDNRTC